jgi:uncharacterized protein YdhG (YjbR/CyaY superfamily)
MVETEGPNLVDEYILKFPGDVQRKLQQIRLIVRKAAPQAIEKISYGVPTFYLQGNLIHYAAYSNHIGFYPTPSGIANFKEELSPYKHAKGSVQFPLAQSLPADLIEKIVRFRVQENLQKNKA